MEEQQLGGCAKLLAVLTLKRRSLPYEVGHVWYNSFPYQTIEKNQNLTFYQIFKYIFKSMWTNTSVRTPTTWTNHILQLYAI